ncbi:hypothetical protein C8Q79DRAFT_917084 [Trametes meyenii]|nr:hypothetical protein C8Q79DRAFT_917084 [Trametes meyenii]
MSSGAKKPAGGRHPRRLFSLDNLKRQRTGSESDNASISSGISHWRKQSNVSSNLLALAEKVEEGIDPFGDTPEAWTDKALVQSPRNEELSPDPDPTPTQANIRTGRGNVPTLDLSSTLNTPTAESGVPPSPSRRRWDTIRSHVLPSSSSIRSSTPPPVPSPPADGTQTPRPSTPRGYRFGQKRSMRHVVDQARDVAHDETRRLAERIRKACLAARFGEQPVRSKADREPVTQNTIGSTLHLPFLASASSSVNIVTGGGTGHTRQATGGGLKRPQSVVSLNTASRAVPTVKHIAVALTSSSTSENRPQTLPCETQVLAALLIPFLGPYKNTVESGEETFAAETFEYVVKTWKATSSEGELDRCLWCCKAASVQSEARARVLGTLDPLLFAKERTFNAETPAILQTLLQSLFSLLVILRSSNTTLEYAQTVVKYIARIKQGESGTPSPQSLEKEYGVRYKGDSDEMVREIITAESIIGCLEVGSEASRRWVLHHLLEEYWTSPSTTTTLTSLLTTMNWRKLMSFINASISLLSSALPNARTAVVDADMIIYLLRTRILQEVEAMQDDAFSVVGEIRSRVIRLILELLCVRRSSDREYLVVHFCYWFQEGASWKQSIEKSLHDFTANTEWSIVLRLLPTLVEELPEEIQKSLVPLLLPPLVERLIADPPEHPCAPLSDFLESVALTSPKAFFKPIFTCAASMKDLTIANQLCALYAVGRFYPPLWTHDPEMMSVALMTDPTARGASTSQGGVLTKGKARYGQLALMLELIQHLKQVRQARDPALVSPVRLAATAKFAMSLEARIGMLLAAKEQHTLVPPSQRLLFCALFRECRLLTRSLKPAMWLPSVVNWASSYLFHVETDEEELDEEEVLSTLTKVEALYEQAKADQRRTTVVSPSAQDTHPSRRSSKGGVEDTPKEVFGDRVAALRALVEREKSTGLELLVTISGLLSPGDYIRIAPILWYRHLDNPATHVVAPTCFLVMQCAEKIPDEFAGLINDDMTNPDAAMRRNAVERIATISSWRFQLMSQEVILDRTYRRPFKLTRPPILFVPTDIGTSLFEIEEDPNDFKDSKGHVLPLELRRRLSEVGWAEERGEMDPKTQWIKTPVARLPTQQLDSLSTSTEGETGPPDSPSPSPSPEPSPTRSSPREFPLGRKDSSAGAHSRAKRRPVFVATMVALFPRLSAMVKDSDFVVANTAKSIILDLMRDDPTVLARSVFHNISGDSANVISAVTTLRNFLHCDFVLPPGMAHHVLNHLAGFLKSNMRHTEAVNPLQSYGYSSPIIAKLTPQVSKISMRDIRRAKVDMLFVPSGSLWWPEAASIGPMFPKAFEPSHNPFETLPAQVVWVTMVRTAQNMMLLNMLHRNAQDVKVVRKNLSTLVLPLDYDQTRPESIPLRAYIPSNKLSRLPANPSLTALSLTFVRSHMLLLHQVFRATSRHLNDREELGLLLDGLNRILLAHGDDVGVVAQAMLNYLVASTRFRRLFTSGGGYTLFMPAVIKVYCDAESHSTIRAIIEFAVNRFFALHQESFVFQTCDVMSNVIALPGLDGAGMCFNIFTLFATLKHNPPLQNPEVAALSALAKVEEQEAIMVTIAERVPQAFLASVHRSTQGKNQVTVDVPDEFDSKRLGLDDLVRLFLTVIAHNPTILRAQQFLRFLLLLTPHLYHASASTRSVLRDGVSALGGILLNKGATKTKGPENASQVDELGSNVVSQTGLAQAGMTQSSFPSDLLVMRLDFLSLVVGFTRAGGQLSTLASQRVLEIVKVILKDSRASVPKVANFLADYVRSVLIRPTHPELKETVTLLTDVAPIISTYCSEVDFSGVFDVVSTLAADSVFATQPAFARVVVNQYCTAGLEACEVAASADVLFLLAIRGSLLNLMDRTLLVVGADVVAELEKRDPTYEFLSGVILPLVLRMKTSIEIANDSQWAEKWRREVYSKAWMRLLVYVLSVVQRSEFTRSESRTSLTGVERRKSTDSRTSTYTFDPKPAMALVVALQILKVIMTRAEQELSVALPGIWGQIGAILREALADGDASFAVPSRVGYSEPPSPTHSPKAAHFNIPDRDDNPFLTPSHAPSLAASRTQKRPRILDYMTWSLIEWLCLRRNPLALQMRVFVQEKVATLHQELSVGGGGQGGGVSPVYNSGFISPSRPRSRPVSNIFSKPRRSFLGATDSVASTPRSSTLFTNAVSLPTFDDFNLQSSTPRKASAVADDPAARQPGYQLMPSPLTPSRRAARDSGPKIVHLGPVRPLSPLGDAGGRRSTSPSGSRRSGLGMSRSALGLAREMVVEAPILVRTTLRRIRLAQAMLGYPPLPLATASSMDSGGTEAGEGPEVRAWSRAEALEALIQETKDLIEEWREENELDVGENSGILVDMEEPLGGQL